MHAEHATYAAACRCKGCKKSEQVGESVGEGGRRGYLCKINCANFYINFLDKAGQEGVAWASNVPYIGKGKGHVVAAAGSRVHCYYVMRVCVCRLCVCVCVLFAYLVILSCTKFSKCESGLRLRWPTKCKIIANHI